MAGQHIHISVHEYIRNHRDGDQRYLPRASPDGFLWDEFAKDKDQWKHETRARVETDILDRAKYVAREIKESLKSKTCAEPQRYIDMEEIANSGKFHIS